MKDHPRQHDIHARLRSSFGRGLATYHHAATVQQQITKDLVSDLLNAGAPSHFDRAFEFGCGTGHLSDAVLAKFQIGSYFANDLVPDCGAQILPKIAPLCHYAEFRDGAIEQLSVPEGLDLVLSSSTLQWVEEVPAVLARLSRALRPGGWLAISTFGQCQFHQLVALGSDAAAPAYMNADELAACMPTDFEIVALKQDPIVLQFSTALQLLRHLRDTGVNARSGQIWSPARLHLFEREFRARFERNGQLPLTYDTVRLIARKR